MYFQSPFPFLICSAEQKSGVRFEFFNRWKPCRVNVLLTQFGNGFSLLLVDFISDLRAFVKILPADQNLFASTSASSEDLFSSESLFRSLPYGSRTADITWNDDRLIAVNRSSQEPQDHDLRLDSIKPNLPYELCFCTR